jgi:hypothetical protein
VIEDKRGDDYIWQQFSIALERLDVLHGSEVTDSVNFPCVTDPGRFEVKFVSLGMLRRLEDQE